MSSQQLRADSAAAHAAWQRAVNIRNAAGLLIAHAVADGHAPHPDTVEAFQSLNAQENELSDALSDAHARERAALNEAKAANA